MSREARPKKNSTRSFLNAGIPCYGSRMIGQWTRKYFNNSLASCEARRRASFSAFPGSRPAPLGMSIMSINSYYDNAVNGLFITAGCCKSLSLTRHTTWRVILRRRRHHGLRADMDLTIPAANMTRIADCRTGGMLTLFKSMRIGRGVSPLCTTGSSCLGCMSRAT